MKYRWLFILSLVVLSGLYLWHPNSLFITDIWFHLLLAKQSATKAFLPLFDTYTFQPIGRIQIYPPLLHIVMGLLSHVFSWKILINYFGFIMYLCFLIVLYIFSAHFWKEKMALLITLAATLSLTTTLTFLSIMPSAICMTLILGAYLSFSKKKLILTAILLGIACYIHPVFPYLGMLGLLYYAKRYATTQICAAKKTISLSLAFALPWLLWIVFHVSAFNFDKFWFDNPLGGFMGFSFLTHYDLNLILLPLSLWGLYYTRTIKDEGLNLMRSLLYVFIPVFLFYGGRYTWHLMPILQVFMLFALAKLPITKKIGAFFKPAPFVLKSTFFSMATVIILLFPMPLFNYPPSYNPNGTFSLDWSAFALPLINVDGFSKLDDFQKVLTILQSTPPNTIIVSNKAYIGNAFTFYSDVGSDYGLYWENTSNELLETISEDRESARPRIFIYDNEEIPYPVDNVYNVGRYTIGERF